MYIISSTTSPYELLYQDSNYYLPEGSSVTSTTTAIFTNVDNVSLHIDGTVAGGHDAIRLDAYTFNYYYELVISPTGTVRSFGDDSSAVQMQGHGSKAVNQGTVTGATGFYFLGSDDLDVVNSGTTTGLTSYGMYFWYCDGFQLNNSGTITSLNTTAVYTWATDNPYIYNTGTIEGVGGLRFYGASGTTNTVYNFGTIAAFPNNEQTNGSAIFGSAADDYIVNRGVMLGTLSLLSGDNYLDTAGGEINGTVSSGSGDDYFIIDDGNIVINAGSGSDTLEWRGDGSISLTDFTTIETLIIANTGETVASGTSSSNKIIGSSSKDVIFGLSGGDDLEGGDGDDYLLGGADADLLNGGLGTDIVAFIDLDAAMSASLLTGTSSLGDSLTDIEGLLGSNYNDTLEGNTSSNHIEGGLGADMISGGDGDDILYGDAGSASQELITLADDWIN